MARDEEQGAGWKEDVAAAMRAINGAHLVRAPFIGRGDGNPRPLSLPSPPPTALDRLNARPQKWSKEETRALFLLLPHW
jgi:hypothetical protein